MAPTYTDTYEAISPKHFNYEGEVALITGALGARNYLD